MFHKCVLCPQPEDMRDYVFDGYVQPMDMPDFVTLRNQMPDAIDQGKLGSCTANSASSYIQYLYRKYGIPVVIPSRLYIYYNARVLMSKTSPHQDNGTTLRDTCKSIAKYGVCSEHMWEYNIRKFNTTPPLQCYKEGKLTPKIVYSAVKQDIDSLKSALILGFPIIFGMVIFSSFRSEIVGITGNVPIPKTIDETYIGSHALLIVGYDNVKRKFIILNSWSKHWGDQGYCEVDYDYIINPYLAGDFWTMQVAKT